MPDATSTPTDPLDTELRRIADALVAEAPDSAPPIDDNQTMVTEDDLHTAHRPMAAAAGVAAAVLALMAGVVAVTDDSSTDTSAEVVTPSVGAAPQRLFIDDIGDGRPRELTRDGKLVDLEVGGLDPQSIRPLPLGGYVVAGHPVGEPSVPETFRLITVGADGGGGVNDDILASELLGATEREAILARQPEGEEDQNNGLMDIVIYDLYTVEPHEQVVRRDVAFDPPADDDTATSTASTVVGNDLVTVIASGGDEPDTGGGGVYAPGTDDCTLRLIDLASGEQTEQRLTLGCSRILGVKAGLDGSHLAVAYEGPPGRGLLDVRLAVVDPPSGGVRHDQLVGHSVDCTNPDTCPSDLQPFTYLGMAWEDDSALRIAKRGPGTSEVEVETVTVP